MKKTSPLWINKPLRCVEWKKTSPLWINKPLRCVECTHPFDEHSREPGVGCLHVNGQFAGIVDQCPCLLPGTSQADQ